ncbi:MAG: tRNA lysidine(34) synthetase TilS [Terriglobales bacterium]
MRERVFSYICRHGLMRPGDRVGVAVSGGADSVALLRLLLELRAQLGVVLSVLHFNHKIRGADADADQQFVAELARAHDLEFHGNSDNTPAYAKERNLSLEAAGRKLRYAFFDRLTAGGTIHRVATAHTRDDQAETVLMRLLRGTGTKGLAGIYRKLETGNCVVRPVLDTTRIELRAYLRELNQPWREDASNLDVSFTRNRLRHEIMPFLRQLNPNLDEVLSDMAEIARAEEQYWSEQIAEILPRLMMQSASGNRQSAMRLDVLLSQPLALQRRLIRMLLEMPDTHLDFRHVEAVLALAASDSSRSEKVLELPNDVEAVRQGRELWFRRRGPTPQGHSYALTLRVPGECEAAGRKIRALLISARDSRLATCDSHSALLDSALAARGVLVRNWRPGDRYCPAHTRGPKKLKELLQSPHIPRDQKPWWPVIVSGEDIVWVPGFAAPEKFQAPNQSETALLLEEVQLSQETGNQP